MEDSKTKEKVLKKIRKALIHKTENRFPKLDFDSPIYNMPAEPLEVSFAEQFKKVNGHFVFCENEAEFMENLKALVAQNKWDHVFTTESSVIEILDRNGFQYLSKEGELHRCKAAITCCEALVARTGTVMVTSRQESGRRTPVYPDYHIVFAKSSQMVQDIGDAIDLIRNKYRDAQPSMIAAITGPSRTADIEKTLVQGAHGPKEIYVFLLDDLM